MEPTQQSQLNFIIEELNNTDRSKFPWLIASGHRPMYCFVNNDDDCTNWEYDRVRLAYEELFYNYNVTMYISAHEHCYERLCPIYNGTCQTNLNSTNEYHVDNLTYPIHIINGGGGNIEGYNSYTKNLNDVITFFGGPSFGVIETTYDYLKWIEYRVDYNDNKNEIDNFRILA